MHRWKLLQPGFINWRNNHPVSLLGRRFSKNRTIEWDGTMNMPIRSLADRDHPDGSKILNW